MIDDDSRHEVARRRLLKTTLLGLCGGALFSGCAVFPKANARHAQPQTLLAAVGDRDAAGRLGAEYLNDFPQERDPDRLVALIDRRLAVSSFDATDTERVRAALTHAVRRDYREAQVVKVADWILSRSEARLYALAHLLGA